MQREWPPKQDKYFEPPPNHGPLDDGDLRLVLKATHAVRPEERWVATQIFDMVSMPHGAYAGVLDIRYGITPRLVLYEGQLGFRVEEPFRGRRFAARAVRLVLPIIRLAGMSEVWITCDPVNLASKRSIELAGGQLIEKIEIPPSCGLRSESRIHSLRFRFDL